jgi:PAS domain S-box-containing protein
MRVALVVAFSTAAGLIALPIASALLMLSDQHEMLQRRSAIEVEHLVTLIADGMRQPIWDLNPAAGAPIIARIDADPRFYSLTVTSLAQGPFLDFRRSGEPGAPLVERTIPVMFDGQRIGDVTARIDSSVLPGALEANWLEIVSAVAPQLLFSMVAVALLMWLTMRHARDRTLAEANRELAAFRELTQATIDAAPISITIKDADRRFVIVNRTAMERLGMNADEAIGKTLPLTHKDPDKADFFQEMAAMDARVYATGEAMPFTAFNHATSAGLHHQFVSKTPILDQKGKVAYVTTISIDVTDLKEAEAAAIAAKEEAELANMAKSEFLANMSHELRTPLNAILGFSEIMQFERFGPLGNDKYLEYARDIHRSGDHLHTVITGLLDLARIEVGAIELDIVDVDLAEIVESVCTMLQRKAARAGVELVDNCPRSLPAIRGDIVRLRQILINLVDNAIKFTDTDGRVTIGVDFPLPGRVALWVRDTGVGIAAGDLDRVVEPFVFLQTSVTRNVGGTGLGLSLVRSLTELHGGELHIASQPGEGTTVTVLLPVDEAPARGLTLVRSA